LGVNVFEEEAENGWYTALSIKFVVVFFPVFSQFLFLALVKIDKDYYYMANYCYAVEQKKKFVEFCPRRFSLI